LYLFLERDNVGLKKQDARMGTVFSVLSVPRLYSESRSTESRTTETGVGDFGGILENRQVQVIEEEMTRLRSDLK
jgi:hypothetical protein